MTNIHARKLLYYRDCYAADNSEISINDVFKSTKGDDHFFYSGKEELFSGVYPRLPVPYDIGGTLLNKSSQYFREKQLIYGSHFLIGFIRSSEPNGKLRTQKICAPLIYSSVQIYNEQERYFIRLDGEPTLNTPLVKPFFEEGANIEELDSISVDPSNMDRVTLRLEKWLVENTHIENGLELLKYPLVVAEKDVQTEYYRRPKKDELKRANLVSAAGLFLVDKPKSYRGVFYALEKMTSEPTTSAPLDKLINQHSTGITQKTNHRPQLLPITLSEAQLSTLRIAATESLGVVSGPPGTGKSFTIAATIADRVLNGERVLVVSETEQAVNVVANKLKSNFCIEEGVVRAGRDQYLAELKSYLNDLLKLGIETTSHTEVQVVEKKLKRLVNRIQDLEAAFHKRSDRAVKRGEKLSGIHSNSKPSVFSNLMKSWISYRVKADVNQWEILEELNKLENIKDSVALEYIQKSKKQRISGLLSSHRQEIVKLNKGVRARTSLKQKELFSEIDYSTLLEAFPVWLVSLSSLHRVLPLQKELFDLVIFDEASQCNVASSLPALYRAKRALVIGDSKQLKHVSFLSKKKQSQLRDKFDLKENDVVEFRDHSILDYVSDSLMSQDAVAMLDEHFRSRPDIIEFSNKEFYRGRLKVMQYRPSSASEENINVRYIEGVRNAHGVNTIEAENLISDVVDFVAKCEKQFEPKTIGILSPYRNQTEYLQKRILETFDQFTIDLYCITVGTPYHFQGEERDVMYLSFSVCPATLRAAAYLNREDVFNVAITRAKQTQNIYISIPTKKLPPGNILGRYINSILLSQNVVKDKVTDKFQQLVCKALESKGLETWQNYPIANCEMDILCGYEGRYLAIDLIGYPGKCEDYYKLSTYRLFLRSGLEVLPISYAVWSDFEDECIDAVCRALGINKI